jgi:proteic killer suppression protein
LELAFSTKSLRNLCENQTTARQELGASVAERLKRRVADLRAATSVKELVAGRPYELDGARREHLAVNLCDGVRIVFCTNHSKIPVLECGRVDWLKVSRIKIVKIENHETARK